MKKFKLCSECGMELDPLESNMFTPFTMVADGKWKQLENNKMFCSDNCFIKWLPKHCPK